jgi:hypothetical protein
VSDFETSTGVELTGPNTPYRSDGRHELEGCFRFRMDGAVHTLPLTDLELAPGFVVARGASKKSQDYRINAEVLKVLSEHERVAYRVATSRRGDYYGNSGYEELTPDQIARNEARYAEALDWFRAAVAKYLGDA